MQGEQMTAWPVPALGAASAPTGHLEIVSLHDDPGIRTAVDTLGQRVWPAFLDGDATQADCWDLLFRGPLARFQFAALMRMPDGTRQIVASSNAVPFRRGPTTGITGLPDGGWDGVLAEGTRAHAGAHGPNALSALAIVVAPEWRSLGLADRLIRNMRRCALVHGLSSLVAPVRPTRKADWPGLDFAGYIRMTLDDGRPFDPWIRKHWDQGARPLGIAPCSMRVEAALEQWRGWTGQALDRSGAHHVPGGLAPVMVDLPAGRGVYEEPNLWMEHPLHQP